jgi:RNA polymerase-interacting CarD/CdnL/TRCF family regulator
MVNLRDRAPGEWSRRYKANVAGLKSGDREQVAEVVRQLTEREATKGLSHGEKRMLDRAVDVLRVREPRIAPNRLDFRRLDRNPALMLWVW